MKNTYLILFLIFSLVNICFSQFEVNLEDFGEILEDRYLSSEYEVDQYLIDNIRKFSSSSFYLVHEYPGVKNAFIDTLDYLEFKSRNIVGLFLKDKQDVIKEILKRQSDFKLNCVIYEKENIFSENSILIILNSKNDYDIIRFEGFSVSKFNTITKSVDRIDSKSLIIKLKEWDKNYGIKILSANYDGVKLEFLNLPDDLLSFVRNVEKLCPEIIDQGYLTYDNLIAELKEKRIITLWWD